MQTEGTHTWTGGGTWKPEGKAGYVNATWPLVKLLLDGQGGTLVTPFGPDVTFGWGEVEQTRPTIAGSVAFLVNRPYR